MEKISAMKITGLTVGGFRCFASERSFDFDDVTYITGSNHVGKSSVADALAFAFTGKPYGGDGAMDRLYNEESPKLRIAVRLLDERGAGHELVRTRVNDRMGLTYDGYDVRQKDLDVMFGESDVFLSILNPTYFIERLGNDGQKLLQTHLPLISHEDVLQKLTERQRVLLEHASLLSPEVFVRNLREENREYKESVIAIEGQKSLLEQQKRDLKKKLDELTVQIGGVEEQAGVLRQKYETGVSIKALEEKRAELLLRRDEILADKPKESHTAQLDLNILRAEAELEGIGQKRYESKVAAEMAKLQAELAADGEAYRRTLAVFQNIRPGVTCPTCLRRVTDTDDVEGIKAELDTAIRETVRRGKEKKAQLAEMRELDEKAMAVFEGFRSDDAAKLREKIALLREQRHTLLTQPQAYEASLAELNRQIAETEADLELGGLTAGEKSQLDELEAALEKLLTDYAAMKDLAERFAPDVDAKKKELEEAVRQNDDLIAAALDYLAARNELAFQNLPLDKVAFSLFDIVKTTGEVKNAFRFTYNGRDYRKLSHSEKIFAGMEVSELMKALTGRNYPVFVDDSESVVSLASVPTGQVFLSRVVPNQILTVVGKSRGGSTLRKAS